MAVSWPSCRQAKGRAPPACISGLVPEEKKRAVRSGFHHPAGVKRKVRSGGSARSLVLISKFSPSCRVCLVSMNSAWRGACALGRQQACPGNSGHNLRAVFIIMHEGLHDEKGAGLMNRLVFIRMNRSSALYHITPGYLVASLRIVGVLWWVICSVYCLRRYISSPNRRTVGSRMNRPAGLWGVVSRLRPWWLRHYWERRSYGLPVSGSAPRRAGKAIPVDERRYGSVEFASRFMFKGLSFFCVEEPPARDL